MKVGLVLLLAAFTQYGGGSKLKGEVDLSSYELEILLETHCAPDRWGGISCYPATLDIKCSAKLGGKLDCHLR